MFLFSGIIDHKELSHSNCHPIPQNTNEKKKKNGWLELVKRKDIRKLKYKNFQIKSC